jgi:hypothetical protein
MMMVAITGIVSVALFGAGAMLIAAPAQSRRRRSGRRAGEAPRNTLSIVTGRCCGAMA